MRFLSLTVFLFLCGCASDFKYKGSALSQLPAPKVSSNSLGKNIDELDKVVNGSLSKIDKLIDELKGK